MLVLVGVILIASVFFKNSLPGARKYEDLPVSELYRQVTTKEDAAKIATITIRGSRATIEKKEGDTIYHTKLPDRWDSSALWDKSAA